MPHARSHCVLGCRGLHGKGAPFGQVGLLDGARSREAIVQCVLNYITNDRSCALTPITPLLLLFRISVPFLSVPYSRLSLPLLR